MGTIREWFREKIIRYQRRSSERRDWLQRLSRPVLVTYLSLTVLYFAAYHSGLMTGVYMGNIQFLYMIALISLGLIILANQITVYGRSYAVFFIGLLIVMTLIIFLFTPRYLLT
jgi:hypothetical protein